MESNKWTSLRSSERGLKFTEAKAKGILPQVAPFVGAWIEIRETLERS